MELANNQLRFLRGLCHNLQPVVILGAKGLTPAVLAEIDVALGAHELIKIKVRAEDREARAGLIDGILSGTGAAKVQTIGHMLAIFRPATKPVIALPKALKAAKPSRPTV